jgi:hypothetical protein
MPDGLIVLCRLILIIGIPIVLTLTNVRLLMTHAFPEVIYNLPNFPPDGQYYLPVETARLFTKEDRLYWSKKSLDFILSDPRAGAIEAWKFSDGGRAPEGTTAPTAETCADYRDQYGPRDCTYFYNDREVRHMLDVRRVTGATLNVWALASILSLLALGLLYYFREMAALRWALLTGSAVTLIALAGLVLFILVGFNTFFTLFHQIFFEGGTWMFYWSDSLIRLFPLPFWFSAFLFVGVATVGEAGLIAAIAWWGMR